MSPHLHAGTGYQPTCVVAGAGPGLGLAIAERYAQEGFLSYVLLRRPLRLMPAVQTLRNRGLEIVSIMCDVSSVSSVERALNTIKMQSGRCDVLIYNAYAPSVGCASSLNPQTFVSEFCTNVAGALAFVNGTVQEMRERNCGAMLFSGCGVAQARSKEQASLSIGKAALRALVDCVADDVEADGIRVGMVTIDGIMPAQAHELRQIAELYWKFFATYEPSGTREVRFRTFVNRIEA
jgi:NAD(P)-dependent dehydrogenase (short-subunit alcohol dehydrogenase family)